jgi:hypothetical protein
MFCVGLRTQGLCVVAMWARDRFFFLRWRIQLKRPIRNSRGLSDMLESSCEEAHRAAGSIMQRPWTPSGCDLSF